LSSWLNRENDDDGDSDDDDACEDGDTVGGADVDNIVDVDVVDDDGCVVRVGEDELIFSLFDFFFFFFLRSQRQQLCIGLKNDSFDFIFVVVVLFVGDFLF
jgi:hypothetical protein